MRVIQRSARCLIVAAALVVWAGCAADPTHEETEINGQQQALEPFCGGFAGLSCPGGGDCVDDPSDDCDPENGGADCGGICECNVIALCIEGYEFDSSPEVCDCVPATNPCAAVLCIEGTVCEVNDGDPECVPIDNACAAVLCIEGTVCEVNPEGDPECVAIDNPCAAVLCIEGTNCEVNDAGDPECVPIPDACATVRCRAGTVCEVQDDGSAACVEAPHPCAAVLCLEGTVCEVNPEGEPECVPADNACAAVLCIEGTVCEVNDEGEPVCIPIDSACAAVLCLQGTVCEVNEKGEPECVPLIDACSTVRCRAGTTCEVQDDGSAACVPVPEGPFCGGFAGIECPGAGTCVDDPSDDCDPENGGADCGGICTCGNVLLLCIEGTDFDQSPDVCACVPVEPTNPCAAVLCMVGTSCEVQEDGTAACIPLPSAPACDGENACPGLGRCADPETGDTCEPEESGHCVCDALAKCRDGQTFDSSPDVCSCVGGGEDPNPCATVLCPQDTRCELHQGEPTCIPFGAQDCGPSICDEGTVCCNFSCGICTPPDGVCTQQLCL